MDYADILYDFGTQEAKLSSFLSFIAPFYLSAFNQPEHSAVLLLELKEQISSLFTLLRVQISSVDTSSG